MEDLLNNLKRLIEQEAANYVEPITVDLHTMTFSKLPTLSKEEIGSLTKEQIESLHWSQLPCLTDVQMYYFSLEQICWFENWQVSNLSDSAKVALNKRIEQFLKE